MSRVKNPSPPPSPPRIRFAGANRPQISRFENNPASNVILDENNTRMRRNENIDQTLSNESEQNGSMDESEQERHNQPLFLSVDLLSPPPAYDTLTPPAETPPPSYHVCLQAIETTVPVTETTSSDASIMLNTQ